MVNPARFASVCAGGRKARPIRALGLDMDGTLLNSQALVSARNADAVRAALAAGVLVFIATGKVIFVFLLHVYPSVIH